jgi:hypothetical protein
MEESTHYQRIFDKADLKNMVNCVAWGINRPEQVFGSFPAKSGQIGIIASASRKGLRREVEKEDREARSHTFAGWKAL